MSDSGAEQRGIVKLVLTFGAIATAIVSIYGLWQILVPSTPEASGEFTEVRIDGGTGGVTVNFEVEISGFKDQALPVTWTLYDYASRSKVPNTEWHDVEALTFSPEFDRDQGVGEVWIPHTGSQGQWYVRLELHPPAYSGAPLDFVDSEMFNTY